MCESRRKSYTRRSCTMATGSIAAILFCAILLVGNLPAFNASLMLETRLESINCTQSTDTSYLTINCRNSPANGTTQLEAIERTLADQRKTSLQQLTIENTRITRWPTQICNLTSLREIRFNEGKISELPNDCIRRLTDLEILSVERNQLMFLQDGLFNGLTKLKRLSFSSNNITSIGLRVFSNRSDLPNLQYINLNDNSLTVLEPWPFIRAQTVKEKLVVSLAGNRISSFTNELGWSFPPGTKSFGIKLDLGDNQIRHLMDLPKALNLTTMLDLVRLFGTKAHSPFDIKFRNNPITCDCTDFKIFSILKNYKYVGFLDNLQCSEPFDLEHQRIVTVMADLRNFVCEVKDLCPVHGRCVLVPANRTLIVSLQNTGLRSLPLQLPPLKTERYKYQLDFSRNSITVLSSRAYLVNDTRSLDVSHSHVETVTDEAWTDFSRIEVIRLHGNRLTALPPVVQHVNYSFHSLSLYGNPLSCTCEDSWMKRWLRGYQSQLEGADSIMCLSPSWLAGRVMSSVKDYEHCKDPDAARQAAIATSTAIGILVVLGLLSFLAVHRLRVHLFAAFRFHPFDRDDCEGEEMDYDVFLTCSHEDRSHAFKVLRMLEDSKFKVCYHDRDFMVGQTIADNICQAVFRSRRVLCLVSKNFVDSSYCVYEFETALDHNVKLKRKRVVVLLLEKIDVRGSAVPRELQQYLSSHTVVEYWANNWTNNLLYAMPTKPLGLQPSTDGDFVISS